MGWASRTNGESSRRSRSTGTRGPTSTKFDYSRLKLTDAPDLPALIEIEASRRYTPFAEQLVARITHDAGAVSGSMAGDEDKNGEQRARRRFALFGDALPDVKPDDIFEFEAPDVGARRWDTSLLEVYEAR